MYSDETLNCADCGREFVFSAGQQEFFASKGFTNKPSRCNDCRAARKGAGGERRGGSDSRRRELFKTTCGQCGGVAEVPFEPTAGRPVYCRDCFASRPSHR
ncbi:MAG: zinc-ribbon domain containing protein [Candidatus Eremiobacteraeota bacterium]|nr:zinc-ribbon domain containing protein [Candidatus Eremiobacteraeota bacterium]